MKTQEIKNIAAKANIAMTMDHFSGVYRILFNDETYLDFASSSDRQKVWNKLINLGVSRDFGTKTAIHTEDCIGRGNDLTFQMFTN